MQIKLMQDWQHGQIKLTKASILDIDDESGAGMIKAGIAERYDSVLEVKQVNKEIQMAETKDVKVENEVKAPDSVKDIGFKSNGEFFKAVVNASNGKIDSRLYDVKSTGQSEGTNADGGFTVTTDIAKYIMQQAEEESKIASKCAKLEIGPYYTGIKIPQVLETTRTVTGLFGGVRIYSPGEGVQKTPFKQAYSQKDIQLKKMAAVNYVTDEMLQDNVALEGFIRLNVGKAFAWSMDNEVLFGTLGAMTALVGHAACATTTFAGTYPTATEISTMYSQNFNRERAEWYMTGVQYGHLIALATTGTFPLFQPDYTRSPNGTLLGRPINIIEQGTTSTSRFMFLDLSDYIVINKGSIQEATSIHVNFLQDETAFRWVIRLGGAPAQASAVTLPDGQVYSSTVTVA